MTKNSTIKHILTMFRTIDDIKLLKKHMRKFHYAHSKEVGMYMWISQMETEETHENFLKIEKKFKANMEKLKRITAINIIKKHWLKCYYSPHTRIGKKHINKLYDENFEE